MVRKSDFNFIDQGFYICLYPNNDDAEIAWNEIDTVYEGCRIPRSAWPSTKLQLKSAGYSIRKQRKVKINYIDDALLADLCPSPDSEVAS